MISSGPPRVKSLCKNCCWGRFWTNPFKQRQKWQKYFQTRRCFPDCSSTFSDPPFPNPLACSIPRSEDPLYSLPCAMARTVLDLILDPHRAIRWKDLEVRALKKSCFLEVRALDKSFLLEVRALKKITCFGGPRAQKPFCCRSARSKTNLMEVRALN